MPPRDLAHEHEHLDVLRAQRLDDLRKVHRGALGAAQAIPGSVDRQAIRTSASFREQRAQDLHALLEREALLDVRPGLIGEPAASPGSPRTRSSASASAPGSCSGTVRPVSPSMTVSLQPVHVGGHAPGRRAPSPRAPTWAARRDRRSRRRRTVGRTRSPAGTARAPAHAAALPQHVAEAGGRRRRCEFGSQRTVARDLEPHRDVRARRMPQAATRSSRPFFSIEPGDRNDQQRLGLADDRFARCAAGRPSSARPARALHPSRIRSGSRGSARSPSPRTARGRASCGDRRAAPARARCPWRAR